MYMYMYLRTYVVYVTVKTNLLYALSADYTLLPYIHK